jgi:hypothetical protein
MAPVANHNRPDVADAFAIHEHFAHLNGNCFVGALGGYI